MPTGATIYNSAGVFPRITDRSFAVSGGGILAGGVVITANRGPIEPNFVTSAQEFIDTYGTPSRDNPSMYAALRFLNRANALTVIRVINDATVAEGSLVEGADTVMDFKAANPGVWGNDLTIAFGEVAGQPSGSSLFAVSVRWEGEEVERFEVSRNPDEKNGFGNSLYVEDVINGRSDFIIVEDDPSFGVSAAWDKTNSVTFTGGSDDTSVASAGDIIAAFELMQNVEEVEAQILINAGWTDPAIQQAMDNVARVRDDAVAILDIPEMDNDDASAMVDYVTTDLALDSNRSAIYGGWIEIYDQYNDREVIIPPSGDVAGIIVFSSVTGERWDAPAGLQRGIVPNVLGVSKIFTGGERDLLYTNRINPVTKIGTAAAVVWGQKMLQVSESAQNRLGVMNSVLWMQGRMKDALQPYVFQNNSQLTRDNIEYLLSSFLENIQTRGGVYAFHVDMSANTPEVIDRNELIVNVHIQPVRTAEFIRLNLIIDRTGISYGS